jgi:predicted CopG family antitoxin
MFIESIAVMATTISVDEDTRDQLKKLGEKGESYDDIVKQLIDQYIEGRYQKLEEDREEFEILD